MMEQLNDVSRWIMKAGSLSLPLICKSRRQNYLRASWRTNVTLTYSKQGPTPVFLISFIYFSLFYFYLFIYFYLFYFYLSYFFIYFIYFHFSIFSLKEIRLIRSGTVL